MTSAEFSSDGSKIVTASKDDTAQVGPVYPVEDIIALLQQKINREMTEEEC
jgi:hypothetical protein